MEHAGECPYDFNQNRDGSPQPQARRSDKNARLHAKACGTHIGYVGNDSHVLCCMITPGDKGRTVAKGLPPAFGAVVCSAGPY